MKITKQMVQTTLEDMREEYRESGNAPMRGVSGSPTPAMAVTAFMSIDGVHDRLATILSRKLAMAGVK